MPAYQALYRRLRAYADQGGRRLRHARFRENTLLAIPFWISSILVGLAATGYEKLFSIAEHFSHDFLTRHTEWAFAYVPACFVGAWALAAWLAPAARGSGIPQLMAAINLDAPRKPALAEYLVGLKTAVVKVVSSTLLLAGGGAIGREGPTIQISAAIFRAVNRLLPQGWPRLSRKVTLITGGAAGLAAAFNTPLGGIVFVVEELTQTHITRFRTAIFSAVIIAGVVAQAIQGPYLYLGYPIIEPVGLAFLGKAALVGGLAGLAGAVFSKSLLWLNRQRARLTDIGAQAAWTLGAGLAFAMLFYLAGPTALGTGKGLINQLLFTAEKPLDPHIFPVRLLGMAFSYASGAAGGIFATSLSAGAVLADGLASALGLQPVAYSLIILTGMVGFLTGVVRSPFTAAILVLEMTDRHAAVFQLLVAGLAAQVIASLVDSRSFYEHNRLIFEQEALKKTGADRPTEPD